MNTTQLNSIYYKKKTIIQKGKNDFFLKQGQTFIKPLSLIKNI